MPVQIRCSNGDCGKMMMVRDENVGKNVSCPSCGTVTLVARVPAAPLAPAPSAGVPVPVAPLPTVDEVRDTVARSGRELGLDERSLKVLGGGLAGLAVLFVSTLFTWVTIPHSAVGGKGARSGIDMAAGKLVFLVCLVHGIWMGLAFLRRSRWYAPGMYATAEWGAVVSLLLLLLLVDLGGQAAAGLYLALFAAFATASAFGYLAYEQLRRTAS